MGLIAPEPLVLVVDDEATVRQALERALRLEGFAVETASITSRRYELAWDARIALWPWEHRRVRLRLYASPSLNVTVLALSPTKSRAAARRRFLHVGNRVMNELRDRLDAMVDSQT